MNILEWIIEQKYARNVFQATAIANGLKLPDIADNRELQEERVRLYRAWRDSHVFNTTVACFALAIAGERVPELELK